MITRLLVLLYVALASTSITIAQLPQETVTDLNIEKTESTKKEIPVSCASIFKTTYSKVCCSKKTDCCKTINKSEVQKCTKAEKKICNTVKIKQCSPKKAEKNTSTNDKTIKRNTANLSSCSKLKVNQ